MSPCNFTEVNLSPLSPGKRLFVMRQLCGETMRTVAAECGICLPTLRALERDRRKPQVRTMQALANYFQVPLTYLTDPARPVDPTAC